MAIYQLIKTQKLPITQTELWDFISSPDNLKEITPKNFGFLIARNSGAGKMYPGMIITYKVKPLFGIPLNWMTDSVSYRPPLGFIGAMANSIFIKRQLEQVFAFRNLALEKRFGKFWG